LAQYPVSLLRVLESADSSPLRQNLANHAADLTVKDPRLSTQRAVELAAAWLLAAYRRELESMDARKSQRHFLDECLDAKLRELDEQQTLPAHLIELTFSRTLPSDAETVAVAMNGRADLDALGIDERLRKALLSQWSVV
jgi:hypothetical protein